MAQQSFTTDFPPPADLVPAGSPAWVTAELLAYTLRVWQPYYREPLTTNEALEILTGVGRLWQALAPRA